jgi:hypothetical protein
MEMGVKLHRILLELLQTGRLIDYKGTILPLLVSIKSETHCLQIQLFQRLRPRNEPCFGSVKLRSNPQSQLPLQESHGSRTEYSSSGTARVNPLLPVLIQHGVGRTGDAPSHLCVESGQEELGPGSVHNHASLAAWSRGKWAEIRGVQLERQRGVKVLLWVLLRVGARVSG